MKILLLIVILSVFFDHSVFAETKYRVIDEIGSWTAVEISDEKDKNIASIGILGDQIFPNHSIRIMPTGKIVKDGKLVSVAHIIISLKDDTQIPINRILIDDKEVKMTGIGWLTTFRVLMEKKQEVPLTGKIQVRGNDKDGNLYKVEVFRNGWSSLIKEAEKVMKKRGLHWATPTKN